MKISEIRDVIRGAEWLRNDYVGHTASEFRKAPVAARLQEKIAALQSLVIAPRFARDIQMRDREIQLAREMIAYWERERATPDVPAAPRHVFLGGHSCVKCGIAFGLRQQQACAA